MALSSLSTEDKYLVFVEAGKDDFISKPFVKEIFISKIRTYMRNYMFQRNMREETQRVKEHLEQVSGPIQKILEGF